MTEILPEVTLPTHHGPPAFAYESTGVETQFTNALNPDPRNREVLTYHRPETLIEWATQDVQLRARFGTKPCLT